MPPRGFPPMSGNMGGAPFQLGGMTRGPMQGMGGLTRAPMQSMGRMPSFGAGNPMGGAGNAGARGLLSRLFQRSGGNAVGNVANAASGFQRAGTAGTGGGSFLQNLANPGNINSFLNNTQNVLRTAQQVGPMFQQYGPLVKNIPAMWRMYKGLKSVGTDDDTTESINEEMSDNVETVEDDQTKASTPKPKRKKTSSNTKENQIEHKNTVNNTVSNQTKGASIPKLYI